ncbi:FtsK/SpoIIIE domain-containing protein [Heyndrickxia sp. FSL K6-6286]|uniref:FtsK/SpoIIIE domain-containing protein n=1 Tax=Heyndrickxia sp. FSL K6-6286 TaxID=2921510 RepID=UPI003159D474
MILKEYFYKQNIKSKLLDCFRSSGLYLTNKRNNRTIYIYPKIHAVVKKENENSTYITFTLLNGIDPKELKKKYYVFQQYFGKSIDLQGDLKKYTLYIYHKPLQSNLIYSYKDLVPYFEDISFPIVTGQKKNGRYLVLDALELPHVIIQGTTGSGKSSAIRVILTTLIQYFKPSELEIYCIDGKKAEFGLFKKVEHVQSVVHSNKHAKDTLNYVVKEMSKREDLLDTFDVPHINDLPKEHRQKYILVAVDEFIEYLGDKGIMESIIKITSKGRAVGIILLASAQRMDADIMDTKARTNFNIRMSFRTVDKTNAMLLGTKGSELIKREEKGRFILNSGEIEELQSPHLTYEKAKEILNPYCVIKGKVKEVNDDSVLKSESNKNNELDFFL